jgi:hypothetical protein
MESAHQELIWLICSGRNLRTKLKPCQT